MKRREFIKWSAISSIVSLHPTIALAEGKILIQPSGADDTVIINAALKASARGGQPAVLANGAFSISDTLVVPSGARLVGQGRDSMVSFSGGKQGVVVNVKEPLKGVPVTNLVVEDSRSLVPFIALIG